MNFAFFPASIFVVAKHLVRLRDAEGKRTYNSASNIIFHICLLKENRLRFFFKPISRLIIDRAIFVRFCSSAPIPLSSQMEKEKVDVCLSRRGIRGDLYSFG